MSTVKMLKDHSIPDRSPAAKGDLVSVPYLLGQQLIADGVAVYPLGTRPPKAVRIVDEAHAQALEKQLAEARAELAELKAKAPAKK